MLVMRKMRLGAVLAVLSVALLACSGNDEAQEPVQRQEEPRETIWSLFQNREDPATTVRVNKYVWNATFEVLDFLPVETVDPFTGVIVTGWGQAPGSSKSYRATILVSDPALDVRALRVSLMTRSGPADEATVTAVEDAILTRARQLRLAASQ